MGEFFVYPSLLKKFNGVSEGYDKSARKTNTDRDKKNKLIFW